MPDLEDRETEERLLVHNRTGYVRGCRCELCVKGNREYQRDYMQKWRKVKKDSPAE